MPLADDAELSAELMLELLHRQQRRTSTMLAGPAAYAVMVGVLYKTGSASWRAPSMFAMGVWLAVIGIVAAFFGAPANYLVMAIFGCGAFVILAVLLWAYSARLRRSMRRIHG